MLDTIWAIAFYSFKDAIRNKILLSLIILAILFSGFTIFIAKLFTWDLGKVAVEFGISTIGITGLIVIFFMTPKFLTDDIEKHSIYLIKSRPVSDVSYIIGKFLAFSAILLLVSIILGFGSFLSVNYINWQYPAFISPNFSWITFLLAIYFQWLSLLVILALTFFWFMFAVQPFVAVMLSVSTYFVGQNMALLRSYVLHYPYNYQEFGGQEWIVYIISWIFPNLSFFNFKTVAAYGLDYEAAKILFTNGYAFSYISILLLAATYFFTKKELF